MVLPTVFGVHFNFAHFNFYSVLSIQIKMCRYNVFSILQGKMCKVQKIGLVSEVSCACVRPVGIGRTFCPGLVLKYFVVTQLVYSCISSIKQSQIIKHVTKTRRLVVRKDVDNLMFSSEESKREFQITEHRSLTFSLYPIKHEVLI